MTLLVDPMFDEPGARPPVPNTANYRRNPLVQLPLAPAEVVEGVDAVLITHLHEDHFDQAAMSALAPGVPLLCQPEDEGTLIGRGFTDVRSVEDVVDFKGIAITRTPARHGTGEIGELMAPASGFVVAAEGEPALYVAGDTIWCDEVAQVLAQRQPHVTVVNAGAAQFVEGGPITMNAADVIDTAQGSPWTQVVAVHMEAINHCLLTRQALRDKLGELGLGAWVLVPADGEELLFQ